MLRRLTKISNPHKRLLTRSRLFSSAKVDPEPNVEVEKQKEKPKIDLKKFSLQPRVVKKSEAVPPVVKEFFVGEINSEHFPFLEVVNKEHVDKFFNERDFNTKYFKEITQSSDVDIKNVRDRGHFGFDIAQEFNGSGFSFTETTLNSEIEAENLKINTILNNHRLVAQIISEYGSEEQKERYLRRLATGELIGTVAIFERTTHEERVFNTFVTPADKGYVLNGEKDFVLNPYQANLLLVLASNILQHHDYRKAKGISVLLVEDNFPGVIKGQPLKTVGLDETEQASVTFEQVSLTQDNIIGKINDTEKISRHLLRVGRVQSAITAIQLMKRILNDFTNYSIESKVLGGRPKDWDLTQVRVGRFTSQLFAAESMVYFTTSLMDAYENQDVDLEAAASKIFAYELLLELATLPFHTVGPKSTLADDCYVKNISDALQIFAQGETMDTLKLFTALVGLSYSGMHFAEAVEKNRNPTMHPEGFLKNLLKMGGPFDGIKITKNFIDYLHPSLDMGAKMLETSLKRFKIAVEISLSRHGQNIAENQTEVARISEIATLLYSALATLSRASRSYCIGVQYADVEINLANSYSVECFRKIKRLTEDIEVGENLTNDLNHKMISKQVFGSKGYFAQHPLYRMF